MILHCLDQDPMFAHQEKSLSVMYKTPCNLKSPGHYTRIFLDLIILSFCQSYYFYYPSYPIFSSVTLYCEEWSFRFSYSGAYHHCLEPEIHTSVSSYFCLLLYDMITIHKSNTRDRLKQSCKYMKDRSLTSAVWTQQTESLIFTNTGMLIDR